MQLRYLSTSTDGIVLCSGKWHFEMAVHAITTLRKVLNCTLPIEIHYGGKDDLEPNMIQAFNSMENVRTVNILDYFPVETKLWGGWSMKPFAMLASSFRRVIFVDADALFFQDPRVLLHESAIVKRFGQMFYYDRTLGGNDPWWFKSINPQFSKYSSTLRYMQKDKPRSSQHEMESGVVVVDKGRTGVLHAMLLVCKMNSKVERDGITYHRVYGDKETYWISWDLIRVPYRFTPSYGGTIGYRNSKGNICGGLFHTDERLRPLWWNGGVMANKHISKDAEFMKFEFAAFDSYGEGIVWEWETKTTPFCLGPRDPDHEVLELTAAQKEMGSRFVDLYKEIRLGSGGWEEYFRKTYKVEF
ncbi:mannosyltransferase putative-domain-containing protein [Obelidium mucronatum]|nr:mannosyltransferase putative-domain-containing protein [Obelidium mucronatum]